MTRSKWFLPSACVVAGAVFLGANWLGGNLREGIFAFVLMAALGLAVLLGGRSETVRGLRGDARDERFRAIDLHASAFAGLVLIVTLVVLVVARLVRGEEIDPYGQLLGIAGASYVVALAFLHWRS